MDPDPECAEEGRDRLVVSLTVFVGRVKPLVRIRFFLVRAVLPANFYINVQQMLHNYICCNIKAQQMLQLLLFNLWRFRSKCWTIYICYKHSVAAGIIMVLSNLPEQLFWEILG